MLRFERLKRDARNGDVNALEEMKRLADTIGE